MEIRKDKNEVFALDYGCEIKKAVTLEKKKSTDLNGRWEQFETSVVQNKHLDMKLERKYENLG